ncbi:MAG: hypothetical protein AB1705_26215 [Verrucomicrobiota bacterium]
MPRLKIFVRLQDGSQAECKLPAWGGLMAFILALQTNPDAGAVWMLLRNRFAEVEVFNVTKENSRAE